MHRNPNTNHTRRPSRGQALRKIPLLRQARQLWLLYSMLGCLQTIKFLSARVLGTGTIDLNLLRLGVPHAIRLRPRSNDLLVLNQKGMLL